LDGDHTDQEEHNVIWKLESILRGLVSRTVGERGQDLVEYAVLVGGIGIAIGVILFAWDFTDAVTDFANTVGSCISFDTGGCNF
jgi:hypothetical protein